MYLGFFWKYRYQGGSRTFTCRVLGSWKWWYLKCLDAIFRCCVSLPSTKVNLTQWKLRNSSSPVVFKGEHWTGPSKIFDLLWDLPQVSMSFPRQLGFLLRVSDVTIEKFPTVVGVGGNDPYFRGNPGSSYIILSNLATMIHIFVRDLLEHNAIQVADGIDLHNGMAFWRGLTRKPACFGSLYSQK